jgi:hypothetical protein
VERSASLDQKRRRRDRELGPPYASFGFRKKEYLLPLTGVTDGMLYIKLDWFRTTGRKMVMKFFSIRLIKKETTSYRTNNEDNKDCSSRNQKNDSKKQSKINNIDERLGSKAIASSSREGIEPG